MTSCERMSIELPSAWSGSNMIGVTEEDTRMVEGFSPAAASFAAPRSSAGMMLMEAAAVAAPRNLRREVPVRFMGTREYKGMHGGNQQGNKLPTSFPPPRPRQGAPDRAFPPPPAHQAK